MTVRRSSSSSSASFFAIVCSLFVLFALALVIASPLSIAVVSDQQEEVESNAADNDIVNVTVGVTTKDGNSTARNGTSFADMFSEALEKEFEKEGEDQDEANDAGSFNNSVSEQQVVLKTVARVKSKKNETETKEERSNIHKLVMDDIRIKGFKDGPLIIHHSKPRRTVLQFSIWLTSDLAVIIVSATCVGIAFACAGQPVIIGYLLAGSIVGPGGFNFVSEIVQVETIAQFGVIFLLFALGLEFSTTKLRAVRAVAVLGGLLQILLFMGLCGITASLCGGKSSTGVFVGAFLSMSSTAVVLKFLMEKNSTSTLHGQVTIGTLIL